MFSTPSFYQAVPLSLASLQAEGENFSSSPTHKLVPPSQVMKKHTSKEDSIQDSIHMCTHTHTHYHHRHRRGCHHLKILPEPLSL